MSSPRSFALCLALLACCPAFGQNPDTTARLTWSGYVEPYFSYDAHQPASGDRPPFFYSFQRHNEVNINVGFLKAAYTAPRTRANVALAAGTYMNANYAAEPGVLRNILEMNAGLRLSKRHELWVDAGVFGSHIGFESAVGKDCRTLSRSLLAENSPYYEAGAKITYNSPSGRWLLSGLLLNGWQHIQRVSGSSLPSFGTQVQYKPSASVTLNSSTFVGADQPDTLRQMRYFHNLYGIFQIGTRWEATVGFDIGWQQARRHSSDYHTWYTPIGILRYAASSQLAFAGRAEYYRDREGVIIATGTPDGFGVLGSSITLDYALLPNALWRMEARWLHSTGDAIFSRNGTARRDNAFFTTSLAVGF
ncbi:MAG TPA: porin [Saprospiraceae bacterium]|nr:porin [Saprospiraceae bacterium]HND87675.1 porin [Saprospiraceae bacterium]